MMVKSLSNSDDLIDSRDVIERIAEVEGVIGGGKRPREQP